MRTVYRHTYEYVKNRSIKDVRALFKIMRTPAAKPQTLVTAQGITLGEFTLMYVLNQPLRRKKKKAAQHTPVPRKER